MFTRHRFLAASRIGLRAEDANGNPGSPDNCAQAGGWCSPRNRRTVNINTLNSTPLGTSQVGIAASTPGEPGKSQTLTLTVSAAPDYFIDIPNPTLVGSVNVPAVFNGTLLAANGYSSSVTLACGPGAPPSCVINPAIATPTLGGIPFTITVSTAVSQAYDFNITGLGSDPAATTNSTPVTFTALPNQTFDFTIGITPTNASVPAGQPASFNIDVNPTTGSFPNNVTFSCSKLPALTTCTFNPAQVGSGSGDSVIVLAMATTAPIPAKGILSTFMLAFPIAGLLCFARTRPRLRRGVAAAATLSFVMLFLSCYLAVAGFREAEAAQEVQGLLLERTQSQSPRYQAPSPTALRCPSRLLPKSV